MAVNGNAIDRLQPNGRKSLLSRARNRISRQVDPASDDIQLNHRVYVNLRGTDDAVSYPGIVARITERNISIRFPDLKALPKGTTVGSPALLKVPNNCGALCATCAVLEAKNTPSVYIKLVAPQSFTIDQNRKFFRQALFIKARLEVTAAKNQSLLGQVEDNAMTENISAGGVRLNSTLALEVDDTAIVTLRLPLRSGEEGDISSPGIVRRLVANSNKASKPFQVCFEFNVASRREEDTLMAAMFELQRSR